MMGLFGRFRRIREERDRQELEWARQYIGELREALIQIRDISGTGSTQRAKTIALEAVGLPSEDIEWLGEEE